MATVTDVTGYVGRDLDAAHAQAVLDVVTAQAKAHTRGAGFDGDTPNDDIDAVLVPAAARALTNPTATRQEQLGDHAVTFAAAGWLLHERIVLDRYRRRTA